MVSILSPILKLFNYKKFAYTRVMQGSIDLSNMYFPDGVYG